MPTLSKTRFQYGIRCRKRMWQDAHRRELARAPDAATRVRLADGHRVGRLARARFPGGALVTETSARHARAVARTSLLLADVRVPSVFEGAFEHDGLRVRADVLARDGDGFQLIEVKSSLAPREEHLRDLAIQAHVIDASGVEITGVRLLHLSPEYRWGGGPHDADTLFRDIDLTEEVMAMLPQLRREVDEMRVILELPAAPAVEMGPHCRAPDRCPFFDACARHLGADTGLDGASRLVLDDPGNRLDIPAPVHFLDVLSFSTSLPRVVRTGPHQRLPFAWALASRIETESRDERSHCSFASAAAPHRDAITALAAALPAQGPIVMFADDIPRSLAIDGEAERLAAEIQRRAVYASRALSGEARVSGVAEPWSLDVIVRALAKPAAFESRRDAAAAFVALLDSSSARPRRDGVREACERYARERAAALETLFFSGPLASRLRPGVARVGREV